MSILRELFEAIGVQAVKASGFKVFRAEAEPKHVYYTQDSDGSPEMHEAQPEPRSHVALSLQAIVEFAKKNDSAAIWYSREKVVCVLDDAVRRDFVTLDLAFSSQLELLIQLEATRKSYKQAEFIKLLRINLGNCMTNTGNLLDNIRKLKWESGQMVNTNIGHGKASIGRSIQAEVSGEIPLPDYCLVSTPIWGNGFVHNANVKCALEVDPPTESFQLIPFPQEIEAAVVSGEENILRHLQTLLEDAGTPLYYGSPS